MALPALLESPDHERYGRAPFRTNEPPTVMTANDHRIYAFQRSTFDAALQDWKSAQLAAYPHQQELIGTVVAAMSDFIDSDQVKSHKMLVSDESD